MPKSFRYITLTSARFLIQLLTGLGKGIALAGKYFYSLSSSPKVIAGIRGVMVRVYETLRALRANARVFHPQGKIRVLLAHPFTLKAVIAGMILSSIASSLLMPI